METWGIVLLIIFIILIIAVIAVLIWYFVFYQNTFDLCMGKMKEDGMCCTDSSYTSDDYKAVKDYGVLNNIPDTLSGSNENDVMKMLLGYYQKLIDGEAINLGNKKVWNLNLNGRGIMYEYSNPNTSKKDIFLFLLPLKNYNELVQITDFTLVDITLDSNNTGFKVLKYLDDAYTSLKDTFINNYPAEVDNLYIVSADDTYSLGFRFLIDFASTNHILMGLGQVETFYKSGATSGPTNANAYNLTASKDKDLYITSIKSELPLVAGGIEKTKNTENLLCGGDYHSTPYYITTLS